jgi:lysozyme family protein
MSIRITKKLGKEYILLYRKCEVRVTNFDKIDKVVKKITKNRRRYENVGEKLNIPWYFIAAIHNMESSQSFERHLHNGDPLTARTVQIPANRPPRGKPPFTWEESAIDALKHKRLDKVFNWSLSRLLYEMEKYNGWGYRMYHPYVLSPYLWGCSNHYTAGKYVSDGRWSDVKKSKQCGGAVIIRRLEEMGTIAPLDYSADKPMFYYSTKAVPNADKLQKFLNKFGGVALRVDSWPGRKTSNAVKSLFDFYLNGDPQMEI